MIVSEEEGLAENVGTVSKVQGIRYTAYLTAYFYHRTLV